MTSDNAPRNQYPSLTVLFEDESLLAIDKPSGLPSNSLKQNDDSAEKRIKNHFPEFQLVHRLDVGTSGILLFAKTQTTYDSMRVLFQIRQIQKHYLAWSEITPARKSLIGEIELPLTIDTPLAHHPQSKKRMITLPPETFRKYRGKPIEAHTIIHSVTETEFLEIPSYQFEIEIKTGVMHQIRVHLHSLGFGLIGDSVYKSEPHQNLRLGLHAHEVSFQLNQKNYRIQSPISQLTPRSSPEHS